MDRRALSLVVAGLALVLGSLAGCDDGEEERVVHLTILLTNDVHDRASGVGALGDYTPLDTTDGDTVRGGYARLAALISQIREEVAADGGETLVVDSGDYFMGTVYDMTVEDPLALKLIQAVGYDAVTLGNHEFDWGPEGLATFLTNARSADPAFDVPIVASNVMFDEGDTADDELEQLAQDGAIVDKLVIDLDSGLRVGLFGLMGTNADEDAPTAVPVTFDHGTAGIREIVTELRETDGANLVVALSHSGVEVDGTGEDVSLAADAPGIDVIASGHTHTATEEAIEAGSTIIMQSGEHGEWIARLDITYDLDAQSIVESAFELVPVDDTIAGDEAVQQLVEDAHETIDAALEPLLGLGSSDPVAELSFDLSRTPLEETGVGNLCADAVRTVASAAVLGSDDPTPFAMGVEPNGVVRDDVRADADGLVSFSDIYNVLPLGMSPDPENRGAPGWPLVSAYLTAEEIRSVCDVSATAARDTGVDTYYVNVSGVRYEYDPAGPYFGRVNRVFLCGDAVPTSEGGDGDFFSTSCTTELDLEDETTLYRVVTDLYTLLMMEAIADFLEMTGRTLVPKHEDGTPIDLTDPADYMAERVDADATAAGIQEVKNWAALLGFIQGLPDAGGDAELPDIPEEVYGVGGTALGRATAVD